MIDVVRQFGKSLDDDNFELTKNLLSENCQYIIGNEVLSGPDAIADSYKENMIAGRKKMDELEWGQSRVDKISDSEFLVHFTDYLTHKGMKYTHRCSQKVKVNPNSKIESIEHISDEEEQTRLNDFYKKVGILKS